eukprot:m.15410 g.15410  ORF g.15410 m.15410 type:complete len:298 (-) comp10458_c0_seq1:30-923(-)
MQTASDAFASGLLVPSSALKDVLQRLGLPSSLELVTTGFLTANDATLALRRRGFYASDSFLTADGLAYLQHAAQNVLDELNPSMVHPEWILAPHQWLPDNSNWVWLIALQPALLRLVSEQLGVSEHELVLFSTQITNKPPGSGKTVPWHQDGDRCCTVWLPLDDVDEENGTLIVKPDWHRRGRLPFKRVKTDEDVHIAEFYLKHHLFQADPGISMRRFERGSVPICLQAGGVEIHSSYTPHCSMPNTSKTRQRRALILRYQPLSEPVAGGLLTHWHTGEHRSKINYHLTIEDLADDA